MRTAAVLLSVLAGLVPCTLAFSPWVESLLKKMTVAEKAAQLDIYRTADMLTNGAVNMTKAATMWGNLANGAGVLHDVYPYPKIANEMMMEVMDKSRLKIPPLIGAEATHGVQMDDHTIFPSPISLAATFDVDLMKRYGTVVGSEARAAGIHVTWAPVLGLCREPRWGRCEEMMGEDPYLAAELGRATITGLTANRSLSDESAVAPLMKHYVAYSIPEGGHNTAPAHIGRRELLSQFLPPFSAGMDAGAQAVMVSYNEIDGEVNAASNFLLTQILRNRYNGNGPKEPFDGFVSSDFGAVYNIVHKHNIVETEAEAIASYIKAGGSVQGFDFDHKTWRDGIVNSTQDESLAMEALDIAVGRVLTIKERLGLFENPLVKNDSRYEALITSEQHEEVALLAARKAMVLLQNSPDKAINLVHPILPLNIQQLKSIALVGPNGDQPQCGDYAAGGSWGGDRCGGGPINNKRTSSILGGIKELIGSNVQVNYEPGVPIADYNISAPYFTTIQRHSFTTKNGTEGIEGTYYSDTNWTDAVMTRNDYMLSFHFLNYGPDPKLLPASAFSAEWDGNLTPDTSVDEALFRVIGRGGVLNAYFWLDGELLLWPNHTLSKPVSLTKGQKYAVRFKYSQEDKTGTHPAVALQWSLQGTDASARAIGVVGESDVTIAVVGGGTSVTSGEGIDRSSLGLPGLQLEFVQALRSAAIKTQKPLVLVVVQGKAFGEVWIKQSLPAILEAWQSGQAQGIAVAETLFGMNNPAGRTAVSFPASADVLPVYYAHKPSASRGTYNNPPIIPGGLYPPASGSDASILWAFGHGISYGATFNYSEISVVPAKVPSDGQVEVSVKIKNMGTRAAEEVPQLYVQDIVSSVTTPVKQLRGFQRVGPIAPQEVLIVKFNLSVADDLWLVNLTLHKTVEPGQFSIMIGGASDQIQQTAQLTVVE